MSRTKELNERLKLDPEDSVRVETQKDHLHQVEERKEETEKLLRILNEGTSRFTHRLFHGSAGARLEYCENLYLLEKTLKRFYDIDQRRYQKE